MKFSPTFLLFLLFLVLKLTDVIQWSWVWVTSPLWIATALVGLLFAVYLAPRGVTYKLTGKTPESNKTFKDSYYNPSGSGR